MLPGAKLYLADALPRVTYKDNNFNLIEELKTLKRVTTNGWPVEKVSSW